MPDSPLSGTFASGSPPPPPPRGYREVMANGDETHQDPAAKSQRLYKGQGLGFDITPELAQHMAGLSAQVRAQIGDQFTPHFASLFKTLEGQQAMAAWADELTAPLSTQLAELGDELMRPIRESLAGFTSIRLSDVLQARQVLQVTLEESYVKDDLETDQMMVLIAEVDRLTSVVEALPGQVERTRDQLRRHPTVVTKIRNVVLIVFYVISASPQGENAAGKVVAAAVAYVQAMLAWLEKLTT
jgi:hypothetical protein